jgi:glycosyltransferase involved in cell wall biosynthesis
MKKILLIESQEGLEPRRQLFLNALRENGYKIKVIFWDRSGTKPVIDENDGINFEWIKGRANYADIKSALKIPVVYSKFLKKIMKEKFDVIVCGHFFLLPLAVFCGKIKKAKIVYDVVEFYIHDFFMRLPKSIKWLENISYSFENALVKISDGIITIPSFQDQYFNRYKKYNSNVEVIKNVPVTGNNDFNKFNYEEYDKLRKNYEGQKIVIYIGTISEEWGLSKLLDALLIVKKVFPEVKLLILGYAVRNYDKVILNLISLNNLQHNVDLVGFIPYSQLFIYLNLAILGVVPIQPINRFKLLGNGTSRKVFDYMNAGLPVVAPNFGELSKAVEEENCGILVDSSNSRQIAEAIIFLLKNPDKAKEMGQRGRNAVEEKYNWQIESRKLLKVYDNLY